MNASNLARSAYAPANPAVQTLRGTEYAAFERVTAGLNHANAPGANVPTRAAALHANRQLWTALAVDVAAADNALPQSLRARIFYLAEFTEAHSRQALSAPLPLTPLIEVNTAVMRGLRGEAQAA